MMFEPLEIGEARVSPERRLDVNARDGGDAPGSPWSSVTTRYHGSLRPA
jgi:hypothetical protein